MTLRDYIQKKSSIIGLVMSSEAIDDFVLVNGFALDYQAENISDYDKVFLNLVLSLLLRPNLSEGDYSESFDRDSILKWYKLECARLGVEDLVSESIEPSVEDKSYLA